MQEGNENMSTCPKCNNPVDADAKFCPTCGANLTEQASATAQQAPNVNAAPNVNPEQNAHPAQNANAAFNANPAQNTYNAQQQAQSAPSFMQTADFTNQFDPQDVQMNKAYAILAYFGILVLVPIFGAKHSKFARFHANQGLVLFITEIIYGVVQTIILAILNAALNDSLYGLVYKVSPVYTVFSVIFGLLWLVFAVVAIIGIVYAATGKAKELPIIGKFKILK